MKQDYWNIPECIQLLDMPKPSLPSRLRHAEGIRYLYRPATGQEYSGENKMKINLKFGTKKEPVQTGLQVHTHMLAGSNCEAYCKQIFPPIPGLEELSKASVDACMLACIPIENILLPQS